MQRNKAKRFALKENYGEGFALKESRRRLFVQIGIGTAAIAFIAVGIGRQEHLDVMQKAVRICLECIGIG